MPSHDQLAEFAVWVKAHPSGDEKGEAQVLLDHLFQALGWSGGLKTAGATVGHAHMVNDSGAVVGRTVYGGAWRGFRTGTNGVIASTAANLLPIPTQPTGSTGAVTNSTANAINSTGEAVGASDFWIKRSSGTPEVWTIETRAALWWPTNYSESGNAIILGQIHTGAPWQEYPGRSEALAVNRHALGLTVVGTGWITPTGYPRAFVKEVQHTTTYRDKYAANGKMLDLNDAQLTLKLSGQTFTSAEAINDAGWVVGNGVVGGNTRGMVLVPQQVSDN